MVNATPRLLYPRERLGTHCRRVGEPQGRSGRVRKSRPPTGFDPRTTVAHTGTVRKPIHNLPFIILLRRHMLFFKQAEWLKGATKKVN